MDCDYGVFEIQYDRNIKMTADSALKKSIWTETEIEIIKAIKDLEKDEEEQVTANQISHEIDYSSRFIAQRCKELFEIGYIHRDMTSKPYKYSTTEKTSIIFEQIINNEI
jgi:Mn-dependent DtxR family transcriptional regulator